MSDTATAAAPSALAAPNLQQGTAIEKMLNFLADPAGRFFLLSGYAGTGKTFCIQHLVPKVRGRMIFTAPTNKATKVIRDTLKTSDYTPECRTIYSLLGLRLEANGEVKELAVPEDPVDLTQYRAVIVDEASMINMTLMKFIAQTAAEQHVKFIFMGDPAQLPPVKELRSPVWTAADAVAELTQVMRHDNQILKLATALRKVVDHPAPNVKIESDFAAGEGVWRLSSGEFEQRLLEAADAGEFSKPNRAKAIAWRNVTVDALNARIRARIFDNPEKPWLPEDRIIVMEPAKDLNDEVQATTDDEGRVNSVEEGWHPLYGEFKCYRLSVTLDDGKPVILWILHESETARHAAKAEELATAARLDRRRWGSFWDFKEAFHRVRHAYAITAHRAQGSTYDTAFVDWRDILLNRNRGEAFRCLYVACTRPKRRLIFN
jgi:exodeoxyribonuclease-5